MPKVAELRFISKSYLRRPVLEKISLGLEQGRFYALLGINGAGKSTLMNVLMRNELPDSGEAYLFGSSIERDEPEVLARVGYVSEGIQYAVPGPIGRFFERYGDLYPRWNREIFHGLCDQLRLDLTRGFAQFSRGQKMQLALAAALASRAELLLLDEITAVLDPHVRTYFMDQLAEFTKRGGTVLMATNIVSEIQLSADHLLLIHEGRIHFDSPMKELSTHFRKVRKPVRGESHPVFGDPACRLVTINSDGSSTCLIPRQVAEQFAIPQQHEDKRGITAEEVFVYFTKEARGIR